MFGKLTKKEIEQIHKDAGAHAARERMLAPARGVVREIEIERIRHLDKEGWSKEHDDLHDCEQLAIAAACYAVPQYLDAEMDQLWPWDARWDKRAKHDTRKRLIIAASLIVAEIERLDRATDGNGDYWFIVYLCRPLVGACSARAGTAVAVVGGTFGNCVTCKRPFDWLLDVNDKGRPEHEYVLINFWPIKESRYRELVDKVG